MTVDPQYLQLMQDSVVIEPYAGTLTAPAFDAYGKPALAAALPPIACQFEYTQRRVLNAQGQYVMSEATIYLSVALPNLSPLSRITLPDGAQPPILSTKTFDDPLQGGPMYTEIYL